MWYARDAGDSSLNGASRRRQRKIWVTKCRAPVAVSAGMTAAYKLAGAKTNIGGSPRAWRVFLAAGAIARRAPVVCATTDAAFDRHLTASV